MNNAAINQAFLASVSKEMKNAIVSNIAKHYGINIYEAELELYDDEAESIMDYITGPERSAISLIYNKFTGK